VRDQVDDRERFVAFDDACDAAAQPGAAIGVRLSVTDSATRGSRATSRAFGLVAWVKNTTLPSCTIVQSGRLYGAPSGRSVAR
jgi:hypothetical protein